MCPRVQRHDHLRIGQPVEGQRPRKADDMPAVDQPLAILAEGGVEMHLGGVLPQARGLHMFGLFNGDAIDMVDPLTDVVIGKAVPLSCQREIVIGKGQARRNGQRLGCHHGGQFRHMRHGRGRIGAALAHHHPAHIVHHRLVALIDPPRPHPDHARGAVGILLQPDHGAFRPQGVTGIDRQTPPSLGIPQIGHRIQTDIGHSLAKDDVKRRQIIQRRSRQATAAREFIRGIQRMPRGIEHVVKRPLPAGDGARHGMEDGFAEGIVLEEAAGIGFHALTFGVAPRPAGQPPGHGFNARPA